MPTFDEMLDAEIAEALGGAGRTASVVATVTDPTSTRA